MLAGNDQRTLEGVDVEIWNRMARCCFDGGPWPLTLVGDVGTGKTCAALCLLDRCSGGRRFYTVVKLCEELIDVQAGRREYSEQPDTLARWWARWSEVSCTVLDELGARERVSDFQYESVKRAIDERENKPAIFISNLTVDGLERVYDDRIASRLAGGTTIEFAGGDRRIQP